MNHTACQGRVKNRTVPVGFGWFGAESGPAVEPYRLPPKRYEDVPMKTYVATERLYLNSSGEVVKADDPDRQSLLIAVGGQMPEADAQRLGLLDEPDAEAEADAEPAPKAPKGKAPNTKAVTKAPENK
jgi:hypothetical protein